MHPGGNPRQPRTNYKQYDRRRNHGSFETSLYLVPHFVEHTSRLTGFCYHTLMARNTSLFGTLILGLATLVCGFAMGQTQIPGTVPGTTTAPESGTGGYRLISPPVQPNWSPGVVTLMDLEAKFAQDVETNGGKAFATWFAEDAVSLSNGKAAIRGRSAIAASANWDPKAYSLTWSPQGAEMSASNDMGYTWGHYIGRTTGPDGKPVTTSGRYITVWKKIADGSWKVALDAGAAEPPDPDACCTVPKP